MTSLSIILHAVILDTYANYIALHWFLSCTLYQAQNDECVSNVNSKQKFLCTTL
jgi:hypothetical protein